MDFEEALKNRDVQALLAVARQDRPALEALGEKGPFKARAIILEIKNRPDELDFFLEVLGCDPGAGGYFFSGVKDNRTFDVYKKHGISPSNLFKDGVTPEQWAYLHKIGYISDSSEEEAAEEEPADAEEEPADAEVVEPAAEVVEPANEDKVEAVDIGELRLDEIVCCMCDVWAWRVGAEPCVGCSGLMCAGCLGGGYCTGPGSWAVLARCEGCWQALCPGCAAMCDACTEDPEGDRVEAFCPKCREGELAPKDDGWMCRGHESKGAPPWKCDACMRLTCGDCKGCYICSCGATHLCPACAVVFCKGTHACRLCGVVVARPGCAGAAAESAKSALARPESSGEAPLREQDAGVACHICAISGSGVGADLCVGCSKPVCADCTSHGYHMTFEKERVSGSCGLCGQTLCLLCTTVCAVCVEGPEGVARRPLRGFCPTCRQKRLERSYSGWKCRDMRDGTATPSGGATEGAATSGDEPVQTGEAPLRLVVSDGSQPPSAPPS